MSVTDGSDRLGSGRLDGDVVAIETLTSACATPGHTAADRTDLFWSGVRSSGSGQVAFTWTSRKSLAALKRAGVVRHSSLDRWSQAEALEKVRADPSRLRALGALHCWRTMTSEQVAAVIGSRLTSSSRSIDLPLLVAAGLAQRGAAFAAERRAAVPMLWRPDIAARSMGFEDDLTYAEWLCVYAGQEWSWGAQASRHNLLTTELSLRVAEYTPIGTVFGELLASAELLFPARDGRKASKRTADAVWIRPDGMRIVVEATANASSTFRRRVEDWIALLLADRERSTVVLFVDVGDPLDHHATLPSRIRRTLAEASTSTPERVRARIADRLAFVRYRDYFPGPGLVHTGFLGLRVERPTGAAGERFEQVDLLDPFAVPFTPADRATALAPITNSGSIWGVPWWLRPAPIDTGAVVCRLAGLDRTEMPPAKRSELARRLEHRPDSEPDAQEGHGDDGTTPDTASTGPRRPRALALGA